jgi:hypothetical protein
MRGFRISGNALLVMATKLCVGANMGNIEALLKN